MLESVVLLVLSGGLFLMTVGLLFARSVVSVVVTTSMFSFVACLLFYWMDALDVALTEIVVGAVSSVFILFVQGKYGSDYGKISAFDKHAGLVLFGLIAGLMGWAGFKIFDFFGSVETLSYQSAATQYYLLESSKDMNFPNVVTKILASYRGFDTLGEVVVVFIAGLSVFSILGGWRNFSSVVNVFEKDILVQYVMRRLLPVLVLFALYIQFHGDYSPGGGFQAGGLLALVCMFYFMLWPHKCSLWHWRLLSYGAAAGVFCYGLTGLLAVFLGGSYLDYSAFSENIFLGQHIGVFLIEIGVFLTVSCVLALVGCLFLRQCFESD